MMFHTASRGGAIQIPAGLGIYSASGALSASAPHDNANCNGVLVRVAWSDVEGTEGVYDWTDVDLQVADIKASGKDWSLGIIAGWQSPAWLVSAATTLDIWFQGTLRTIPAFWDSAVQTAFANLAAAIHTKYGSDADLKLVYVPQMSGNGIEGHLNGNTNADLRAQVSPATDQRFEDLWVEGATGAIASFASALSKRIAIELHYIVGVETAGSRIATHIRNDPAIFSKVGLAIWWLSGKTDYQANLLPIFKNFPGDKYAQLIDESADTAAFEGGNFASVFSQCRNLGIKSIEVWEQDIVSNAWNSNLAEFNTWGTV